MQLEASQVASLNSVSTTENFKKQIRLYYTLIEICWPSSRHWGDISEHRKGLRPCGGDLLMGEGWEIRDSAKTKKGPGQQQEAKERTLKTCVQILAQTLTPHVTLDKAPLRISGL